MICGGIVLFALLGVDIAATSCSAYVATPKPTTTAISSNAVGLKERFDLDELYDVVGHAVSEARKRAEEVAEKQRIAKEKAAEERKKAPSGVPQRIWNLALKYETKSVPAHVLCGIAKVESDFNPNCVTGVCYGLMQLHSAYEFKHFRKGEHWSDPDANMRVAAIVLNDLYKKYKSTHKMLMVYNEGWSGERSGSSPYSRKVMKWAERYKK